MMTPGRFAAVCIALLPASIASAQAQTGTQLATGGKTLLATVVDRNGRSIVDLGPDDFVVTEDGDDRELVDVRVADYPVAVLLDDSASATAFQAIRGAVDRFIGRIGERPVAIGLLSNPSRMIATLDDERADVMERVRSAPEDPSAVLAPLPAVANAARLLRDSGSPFSAIVVVAAQPIDAAQEVQGELLTVIADSGAVVHVVSGRPTSQDVTASPSGDLLRVLSDQTRGQYTAVFSGPSYTVALDRLADRLSSELMIEYLVPPDAVGGDVKVGVRRPGARVVGLGVK